jgi:glucan endo-1,3-alpha-glucosidase
MLFSLCDWPLTNVSVIPRPSKPALASNYSFRLICRTFSFLSTPFICTCQLCFRVIPCASPGDAQFLRNFITTYATHPNQLIYDGRVFASTFAGESCTFGQGSPAAGWASQFTRHPDLTGQNAVFFVPSFFIDPQTFNQYGDVMDGDFNVRFFPLLRHHSRLHTPDGCQPKWNSGWPIQLTTAFASSLGSTASDLASGALVQFMGSTDTDVQSISGLAGMPPGPSPKVYMGAASAWFFTHYSPQTFNKNVSTGEDPQILYQQLTHFQYKFIFLADDHLYSRRWEAIIAARDQFDLIEIPTWNDYGESHYIGPIEGSQPNSQAWVDGFDHTGTFVMCFVA